MNIYIYICIYIYIYLYNIISIYIDRYRCKDIDKVGPFKVYFTNLYPQLWIHIVEGYRV